MMPSSKKFSSLIEEYKKLKDLDNGRLTPQMRGQKFNRFIADLLNSSGINAESDLRSENGETDVSFILDGHQFLLEAKWEKDAVSRDYISKLRGNLERRLNPLFGIVLSMSGYGENAIDEVKRLSILLLDKLHFEAMLFGFISPKDLIGRLLSRAQTEGDRYVESIDGFWHKYDSIHDAEFYPPNQIGLTKKDSVESFSFEIILSTSFRSSIREFLEPNKQKLILINNRGIYEANFSKKQTKLIYSIPCGDVLFIPSKRSYYLLRQNAFVELDRNKKIKFIDGGAEFIRLWQEDYKKIWVFSRNSERDNGRNQIPQLVCYYLDEEKEPIRYFIDTLNHSINEIFFIGNNKFLILTLHGLSLAEIVGTKVIISKKIDIRNSSGLIRRKDNIFLISHTYGNEIYLSEFNLDDQVPNLKLIAKFNLCSSSELIAINENDFYMCVSHSGQQGEAKTLVIKCSY